MTTSNIRRLLERRFCRPEWALFHEVAEATGMSKRRADAIAMNLWESRGLAIHGFEIKISRSDWLRELREPAKAEAVMRNCDHWWVVAPKGIVLADEVPVTWGHYEVDGRGICCARKAPQLDNAHVNGVRSFMAALIRRAGEFDEAERDRLVRAETERIRAKATEEAEQMARSRSRDYDALKAQVDAFERRAGIRITEYVGGDELGRAVALVQRLGPEGTYRTATGLHHMIADMAERLGAALEEFRKS